MCIDWMIDLPLFLRTNLVSFGLPIHLTLNRVSQVLTGTKFNPITQIASEFLSLAGEKIREVVEFVTRHYHPRKDRHRIGVFTWETLFKKCSLQRKTDYHLKLLMGMSLVVGETGVFLGMFRINKQYFGEWYKYFWLTTKNDKRQIEK